ncbi:hypothetical protein H4R33_004063 [Dimargaris cristalligena]|uniref:mannose-1-phosphate guanylyltransferase n=1 Tax=Dimargaris cristalligena TaxID=215637 RepID=A0A4P9ZQ96_9FUNG|nr:hypothetical protein H4R33_004063 [Dimargaris cristalligena]RKP35563.1 mannose-1-phosphate guanyltransferase [Dimargaris cristalligena]|eukprot:RKP35563.1 mannose-1-phosphate guanyltransferase [Dimargaris cristalligena]
MSTVKAVILVGGPSRGTRFRPLSMNVPKPLFPVAGRPIIWHPIAALAKLKQVTEILLVGFFEDFVFREFLDSCSAEFPNIHFKYLREYQSLGTAGGIYHFRNEILRHSPQHIFVLHADVCCSYPLAEMLAFHEAQGRGGTIMGTRVERDDAHRYGCLVADTETNEVLHYVEKPETFISDLISCGVGVFKYSALFDTIRAALEARHQQMEEDRAYEWPSRSTETDDYDVLRLEQDVLRPLAADHQLTVYVTPSFWRQIKSAGSAIPANAAYLDQMLQSHSTALTPPSSATAGPEIVGAVSIHPSARIDPTAKIGPHVSIGPRVTVGPGVRVKNSILLDGVDIKPNSCVLNSVIGWRSKLGSWVRVEGTPVSGRHDLEAITNAGVKNQSITILGQEVVVADECIIRNCIVLPNKELRSSFHDDILM